MSNIHIEPGNQPVPDHNPVRWQPDRRPVAPPWPVPPTTVAMWRGARGLCPACGQTRAFAGYLRVVDECHACGAPLGSMRADDAPPYFTIMIVGHLLVPLMFWVETSFRPALWIHAALWLPLSLVFTLALLRPGKGATLGLMLHLGLTKAHEE